MKISPWQGGGRAIGIATAVAVAGLGLTALGAAFDPRRALWAYLVAFTDWVGIAVAALILLMSFHAANARWPVAVRRVLEVIPLSTALFLVLFLPVLLGARELFPWAGPQQLAGEAQRAMEHRKSWLNLPFFTVRAAFYFAVWIGFSHLFHRWSVEQDRSGAPGLSLKAHRLGAGGLPLLALTLTFAAFDWWMSLTPQFYSTIFGVYYFAGSFDAAIAVLIIAAAWGRREGIFGGALTTAHFHSLGKLLLAFTAFWAYIAFSQFLLIWIANIPEEVPWYQVRNRGAWLPVGVFLALFHFVVPFFVLLSRRIKREPEKLQWVAAWILVVHFVDVYWVVMPHLSPAAPHPHFTDLTALLGVGGAAVAFTLWRLRGRSAVPVGDPYLQESLRYDPR